MLWTETTTIPPSFIVARSDRTRVLTATEHPIDASTAAGKCFLDMLGVFAEYETNLRRERQLEGIVKAKAAGGKSKTDAWEPPNWPKR
jgi:DNA invertase Pin-like site-specific DNA recombinase